MDSHAADPMYSSGMYFASHARYAADADFKAKHFADVFLPLARDHGWSVRSYVDVGCGTGDIVRTVRVALKAAGHPVSVAKGYDVSPHVKQLTADAVEFIHGDFCASDEAVDLVTLFDVFEHVPDPVRFVASVAERCRVMGFHIPLDDSLNHAIRDKYVKLLKEPGHLVFLNSVSALNLLTFAGLKIVAYRYTFSFLAPSGRRSLWAKLLFPARLLIAKVSPWILSKTLGGASLMVIALTPAGQRTLVR